MSLQGVARRKARKYGVNPSIFQRQIQQESGFNPNARSPAGAQGVAQIMPATARSWGVNANRPRQALDAAARHMAEYLRSYHGDWSKALTAYNAGPGAVGGSLPAETKNYISTILGGSSGKQSTPGAPTETTTFGVDLGSKNVLDQAAFQRAKGGFVVGQLIAKNRGTNSPLFKSGLLTTTAPVQQDFMHSVLTSKLTKKTVGGGGGGGSATGAKGTATFEGVRVAAWIKPELEYARAHGWKGKVTSGFRSRADQTRIYNSGVRPAAKPGTSNHEGADFPRGAVDVSDAQTLSRILRRKGSPLRWAGAKDAVHFSHPHGGSY
jgi:hypothetical protein